MLKNVREGPGFIFFVYPESPHVVYKSSKKSVVVEEKKNTVVKMTYVENEQKQP